MGQGESLTSFGVHVSPGFMYLILGVCGVWVAKPRTHNVTPVCKVFVFPVHSVPRSHPDICTRFEPSPSFSVSLGTRLGRARAALCPYNMRLSLLLLVNDMPGSSISRLSYFLVRSYGHKPIEQETLGTTYLGCTRTHPCYSKQLLL